MREFKGTKGNWEKAGPAVVVNGVQIADVYCYGDLEDNRHEATANAQLIATAPELLEALQKAIWYDIAIYHPRDKEFYSRASIAPSMYEICDPVIEWKPIY